MIILAVETATEACSAALYVDGRVSERYRVAPREHSLLILPMVQSLLDESGITVNNIDALAFGCGPGSFTGIRIAAGVVQGIAFAADRPVVPVSTLAAMAQDVFDESGDGVAFTAIDARMGEVYWGVYRRNARGFAELIGAEAVVYATDARFPDLSGVGVGSGWGAYREPLVARLGKRVTRIDGSRLPKAAAVARLGAEGFRNGRAVPADQAQPVYLRDKVARKTAEQ